MGSAAPGACPRRPSRLQFAPFANRSRPNGSRLSSHRQKAPDGTPCVPCEQQDEAPVSAQSAITAVLGRKREALGIVARLERGSEDNRQEGDRSRPRGAARERRDLSDRLKRATLCVKRLSLTGLRAPGTSTPRRRTNTRHLTRSR